MSSINFIAKTSHISWCYTRGVAYRVTINGFDVSMDTADELRAVVGASQRSLPPMLVDASAMDVVAPAASTGGRKEAKGKSPDSPLSTLPSRLSRGTDLGQQFEALRPWWKHLTARQLEYVELRCKGMTAEAIGKKMGNMAASVSVALNIARRKLEGHRDDVEGSPAQAREHADDDDPEPEPEDDDGDATEPDVERKLEPESESESDLSPVTCRLSPPFGGDLLQGYLRAVRSYPMMSRQEELDVATRFVATRDPALAKKLVQANLRYVVKLAHGYPGEKGKLLDLIQEGNLGLMVAVQKFDPRRGFRLTTYASDWINAYMKLFIIRNKRLVKVGTTEAQRTLFWSMRRTREELAKKLGGREPTHEEIAEEFHARGQKFVKASDVESMEIRMAGDESTVERHGKNADDTGEATTSDWLPDEHPRQDELLGRRQEEEHVRRQADALRLSLNPRMRQILDARILSEEPANLQTLADEFGLSRERVRQLEEKILGCLKERLRGAA